MKGVVARIVTFLAVLWEQFMLVTVAEVIRSWQCFDLGMGEKCSSQILRMGIFREEEASGV